MEHVRDILWSVMEQHERLSVHRLLARLGEREQVLKNRRSLAQDAAMYAEEHLPLCR